MAIKFISVKCPNCLANLEIDSSRSFTYCAHCGTKILLTNENEHIYRHIDEARLKEAETDQLIRLQELKLKEMEMLREKELEERKLEEEHQARLREEEAAHKRRIGKIILISIGAGVVLLIVIAVIAFFLSLSTEEREGIFAGAMIIVMMLVMLGMVAVVGIFGNKGESTPKHNVPMVIITGEMLYCTGKPVESVRTMFARAGFKNVVASPMRDLNLFMGNMQGQVNAVAIRGNTNYQLGEAYPENVQVVIFYHSRGSSLL